MWATWDIKRFSFWSIAYGVAKALSETMCGPDSAISHETYCRYGIGSNYFIYTTDSVCMSSSICLYVACSYFLFTNKALQPLDFLIVIHFHMHDLKFHKILLKNTFWFKPKSTLSHNLIFISKHSLETHLKHLLQPFYVIYKSRIIFKISENWVYRNSGFSWWKSKSKKKLHTSQIISWACSTHSSFS